MFVVKTDALEKNDGSSVRRLIEAEIPRLRRYALALTRNRDEADDLVQDCLERALDRAALWKDGTNLRAWLFRIQHNIYISGVRRKNRSPELDGGGAEFGSVATPPNQQASVDLLEVERALSELSDDQREIILLVSLEGLSYAEVADILGVPVGTVRSRLSRGREALRNLMLGRQTAAAAEG